MALDWDLIAKEAGFVSAEAMLKDWYVEKQFTIGEIAGQLECSSFAVSSALRRYGIKVNTHGGNRKARKRSALEALGQLLEKLPKNTGGAV